MKTVAYIMVCGKKVICVTCGQNVQATCKAQGWNTETIIRPIYHMVESSRCPQCSRRYGSSPEDA